MVIVSRIAVIKKLPCSLVVFLCILVFMRASLSLQSFFLVILIALLHKLANMFYWYASIVWFDMLMHFLGGLFLAFVGGAVLSKVIKNASRTKIFVLLLSFVLIVGLGWEVFEFSVQEIIKITGLADIPDSLSDLLFDMIGCVVGAFFVIRAKNKYTSSHNG